MATSSWPDDTRGRPLVVGVLGSARLNADDRRYAQAVSIGGALAGEGWTVMTGGYGGLMEATASGAAQAGGYVIGLPVRGWSDLNPSSHATELRWCDSYPERLSHLLACDAVVALDGGIGTLAEMTAVWAAAQTEPDAAAVIAVGPAWRALLDDVADHLVVGTEDLRLVGVANGADDVIGAVRAGVAAERTAQPRG